MPPPPLSRGRTSQSVLTARAHPPLHADPQTACANLKYFGTAARAEARYRAFLAEHDNTPPRGFASNFIS